MPSSRFGPGSGALAASGLRVVRGGREVVSGLELAVGPGRLVALVGPNGSGKTSALLALKGAVAPHGGGVTIDGVPIDAFDPRVGLVLANPEDQGVSPVVADDVAFGLENQGLAPAVVGRRVEEALRRVALWELRDAPVCTLSGGQAQRLAVATVLALGARFLLLDEATSMLSPWDRDALLTNLDALRREGVGGLLVTHQPDELLWCDGVVALAGGRVAFRGSPVEYFGWGGCAWERPPYLRLAEAARAVGAVLPGYGALCRWLGSRS